DRISDAVIPESLFAGWRTKIHAAVRPAWRRLRRWGRARGPASTAAGHRVAVSVNRRRCAASTALRLRRPLSSGRSLRVRQCRHRQSERQHTSSDTTAQPTVLHDRTSFRWVLTRETYGVTPSLEPAPSFLPVLCMTTDRALASGLPFFALVPSTITM